MIDLNTRISVPPNVLARRVGSEVIVLDTAQGEYFGLPAVGARIWELLASGSMLSEVADVLCVEFDTDRPTAEQDLLLLTEQLRDKGLLLVKPPSVVAGITSSP